jgi:hypothetical protein
MAMALLLPWAALAQTPDTNGAALVKIQPVVWPKEGMLSARGKAELREERRMFAEELRTLKQFVPDNMRGAVKGSWKRGQRTMRSESHAIDQVPEMSAEAIEKIVREMEEGALDEVPDNQERFRVALGKRVPVFAKALAQLEAGKYGDVTQTLDPLTVENVLHCFFGYEYDTLPPYTYCTVVFLEGEAFGLAGAAHEHMTRNMVVMRRLPRCMTYGATARVRLASAYERTKGPHCAVELYQALAERYFGRLSDTETLRCHVLTRRLMNEDQFRRSVTVGREVRRLQDWGITGPVIQRQLACMTLLMQQSIIEYERDLRIYMQSNQTMMGGEGGYGALEKGPAPELFHFRKDVAVTGSDDWGGLRPREKQEMIQQFFATYPDEYREMLEAYFSTMSREETKQERSK